MGVRDLDFWRAVLHDADGRRTTNRWRSSRSLVDIPAKNSAVANSTTPSM